MIIELSFTCTVGGGSHIGVVLDNIVAVMDIVILALTSNAYRDAFTATALVE